MTAEAMLSLRAALDRGGVRSSDFDLNADVPLPKGRRLRDAAVLVPLIHRPAGLQVILTKRSSRLKHHPGQIAFPGGKRDAGDIDLTETALREAEEEIGLCKSTVDVLGTFATHETVTSFTITPVVGVVTRSFDPRPEPGEVDEIFEVPLTHVTDTARFSVQGRIWQGRMRRYYTVPYGPYYIWGATAGSLRGRAGAMEK